MTDANREPTPPAGYTAEELERDNPYNAWMNDMSLETSEADARPCAYREMEQMMIDGPIKIHRPTAQEIASEMAFTGTRTMPRVTPGPVRYVTGTIAHHSVAPVASRQQITDHLESLRTDPLLLAQIDAARMSPDPKVSLKVKDGVVMGVGIDLMREWDTVMPRRPVNAMAAPVDMVLHCPVCHMQHIDAPEAFGEGGECTDAGWANPPHRSHLCHGCGHIWRPADVPTNGVAAVKTKGKNDSPIVAQASGAPAPRQAGQGVEAHRDRRLHARAMTTERQILNLLAAAYDAQRDGHRAAKCRQLEDGQALRMLEQYLEESQALLVMVRADLDRQLEMHSQITQLRADRDRWVEDYRLLVHHLLQRYPG